MPQCVKNDGRESCLQWLKQNELLRCYIEKCQDFENENNDPTLNTDVKLLKRRNAIFLKIISSGPEDWVYFLSYLSLYEDIANGLCLEKENGFRIVDEIENSLHPKLQKDIYESFVRMHPDEFQSYQKHDHFPHIIKTEQGLDLYNFLVSKSFISAETDESSFLYLMGCTTEQPKELKLITWLCNKQLLREMLELLYKTLIENKNLLKAKLEELTSHCFVGKKGNPYKLAKRKVRLSKESDDIKNKIATLLRPSNSIA